MRVSSTYVPNLLREQVIVDAHNRCGYCLAQQDVTGIQLHIEHILPEAAGGTTILENLWRACSECIHHKGAQTYAYDPQTGVRFPLFNPRMQGWADHFRWSEDGTYILGIS